MSTAIDALVARAQDALAEYASFTQEQIDHIVRKASVAALHHHGELAVLAVEETGRGLFEDKAVKNMFAPASPRSPTPSVSSRASPR